MEIVPSASKERWIKVGKKWIREDFCREHFPSVYKKMEEMKMNKKLPSYRLVVGRKNVGSLWEAKAKNRDYNYFSGVIDIDALKQVINEVKVKRSLVPINRMGDKEEHNVIRVAMFPVQITEAKSKIPSW